jgi:hypothetical protein
MSEMRSSDKEAVVKLYRLAERLDDLNLPWLAMELRGNLHTLFAGNPNDAERSVPKAQ